MFEQLQDEERARKNYEEKIRYYRRQDAILKETAVRKRGVFHKLAPVMRLNEE